MPRIHALCRPCSLRLSGWPCLHSAASYLANARRPLAPTPCVPRNLPRTIHRASILHQNPQQDEQPEESSEVQVEAEVEEANILADESLTEDQRKELVRATLGPEAVARFARTRFGDRLPEGALSSDEYKIYQRLFGDPLTWTPEHEETIKEEEDLLLKESDDGTLQEVEYRQSPEEEEEHYEVEVDLNDPSLAAVDPSLRANIEAALRGEPATDEPIEDDHVESPPEELMQAGVVVDEPPEHRPRTHPFTMANRSGTSPSSIWQPFHEMTEPISAILSEMPNKHLREAGERAFGGPGLPYSTGTPRISRTMPQKPIPLSPYQSRMTPIEADVFLASAMPGMYASITSVLVESRRALGTQWLEKLMLKEGGPSILDAGAGGAGIIAWREVLKAGWQMLQEEKGSELGLEPDAAAPLGKATVLTSAAPLRHRMSLMLENTTFLPRLPDYVHIEPRKPGEPGMPHGRKQFDIIVAPHSLWSLSETWQRRQHVQNLWAMLNEDGGVLVLLEKGVPRGFEVLADARQYLLDDLFKNEDEPASAEEAERQQSSSSYHRHASPGAIVAPCTTHSKCPMYRAPGVSKQRKDYCRFSQRYYRPPYHQNILGARSRNHDDVEFSYVSVVRGRRPGDIGRVTLPEAGNAERARIQGKMANERAFAGYELGDADLMMESGESMEAAVTASIASKAEALEQSDGLSEEASVLTTPLPATPPPQRLTLPRLVLPPLKKPGHVLMDLCTPAGTLERWSITKSFGRQAYRDARKSAWGDLWALGAKTRTSRRVRVGKGRVEDGRALQEEEKDDLEEVDEDDGVAEAQEVAAAKNDEKAARRLRGRDKARTRKRLEREELKRVQKKLAATASEL